MIIIALIVVSTSIVMSLHPIKDNLQVFSESTSVLVPQPQEQSGNKSSTQVFTDSLKILVSKSNEQVSTGIWKMENWGKRQLDNDYYN
jgi:hypothetical protein